MSNLMELIKYIPFIIASWLGYFMFWAFIMSLVIAPIACIVYVYKRIRS